MTYSIGPANYSALASDMLPDFKKHARIDFDDDDVVATKYLKWATALVEQVFDFRLAPATVDWTPEPVPGTLAPTMASQYPFPVGPPSVLSVADADGNDITPNYSIRTTSLVEPYWLFTKDGTAVPLGAVATYVAGYDDVDELNPNIEAAIYRVAAHLYENRESIGAINLETVPQWLNDLLVGLWIPRA